MAMNKTEKAALEAALTEASLRRTSPVEPDVPPPGAGSKVGELTKGFLPVAEMSDSARVETACSSSVYHSTRSQTKTDSQGARPLYSTKLLALRALRYKVESECAKRLRSIDRMIEEELAKEGNAQ